MKTFTSLITVLILLLQQAFAQEILNRQEIKSGIFISKIIEYKPAPGQFINTSAWGTPAKAQSLIGGVKGGISLGAYGGYIVVGFNKSIENDPDNPYGIDFTIFGNPLEEWSEPGVIMVMKDENKNGLADDTWYEIMGSDHHWQSSVLNYSLTYYNPKKEIAADVQWIDNQDDTGYVYANRFHSQAYYPVADTFPAINQEKYSFSGTKIKGFVDKTIPTYIKSFRRGFGYADNFPRGTAPYDVPDNPYTSEKEGCGGDPIDIDWAVKDNGSPANLDKIDFVKIYTGINEAAGWLGEVSTEVTAVMDVTPNTSLAGEQKLLVVNDLPPKMSVGKSIQLEANFFIKGIKQDVTGINWEINKPTKANINENNILTSLDTGSITITAKYTNGKEYSKSIKTDIIAPKSIHLEIKQDELRINQWLEIAAKTKDQNGDYIYGLENIWTTSNHNISVQNSNDEWYIKGEKTGKSKLYVHPKGFPNIKDSVSLVILKAKDSVEIFLTIKTNRGTFLPRQKINVSNFNLNPFMDNPYNDYGLQQISSVTLAHAAAAIFDNIEFESDLRFKDSPEGNMYISQIPVKINQGMAYFYGTGGSSKNTWVIKQNEINHINNFAEIAIQPQDEIIVYYIDDIEQPWCLYHAEYSGLAAEIAQEVEIDLYCETFKIQNTKINSMGVKPAEGIYVKVNDKNYLVNNNPLATDENGKVKLSFSQQGIYKINLATEDIYLNVGSVNSTEQKEKQKFIVYPNPANQSISVQFPGQINENIHMAVYSVTGRMVYKNTYTAPVEKIHLNTLGWKNGMYIIQLESDSITITQKIIINHH